MEELTDKWQSFKGEMSDRMHQVEQKVEQFCSRITRLERSDYIEDGELNTYKSEKVSVKKAWKKAAKKTPKDMQHVGSYMNGVGTERFRQLELSVERLEKKDREKTVVQKVNPINTLDTEKESTNREFVKREIKEKAKNFISTLSVHGVPRIVKSDKLLVKLLWTFMISVSVSSGIYIISKSVKDYNQFHVITNIERISPERVTFPAVSICTDTLMYGEIYKNDTLTDEFVTSTDFKKFISLYRSPFSLLKSPVPPVPPPPPGVDLRDFKVFHTLVKIGNYYQQSVCIRFNGITNRTLVAVAKTTNEFGLRVESFKKEIISKDEYVKFFFPNQLKVFVEDNYLNSFSNLEPLNLIQKTGYSYKIEKIDIEYKLGEPYNRCTQNYPGTGEQNYRRANCIDICRNRVIEEKYNCSIPSYYEIDGLNRCTNKNSRIYRDVDNECQKECPEQCETTKFNLNLGQQGDPANSTSLSMSFSDLSSYNITQIPKMNEYALISSIGGALGLFIGARFLSCVEIFEFFIEVSYVLFTNRVNYLD